MRAITRAARKATTERILCDVTATGPAPNTLQKATESIEGFRLQNMANSGYDPADGFIQLIGVTNKVPDV